MKILTKLLLIIFIASIATSSFAAKKASCDPNDNAVKLFKDMVKPKNSKLADAIKKDQSLGEIWVLFKDHDVRLNADFLKKVSKLPTAKQDSIGQIYKNMKGKGKVNYSVTKTINGKPITVKYDQYGFPDFTSLAPGPQFTYRSNSLEGKGTDMTAANNAIKAKNIPGFVANTRSRTATINGVLHTWHHLEDGKTMILIPSAVHNVKGGGFEHTGGAAIIIKGLQGLFDTPISPNI